MGPLKDHKTLLLKEIEHALLPGDAFRRLRVLLKKEVDERNAMIDAERKRKDAIACEPKLTVEGKAKQKIPTTSKKGKKHESVKA